MNKMLLILKHEFLQTITRKGFIVTAILFPLIGLAAIGIFQLVQSFGSPEEEQEIPQVGIVDRTGIFDDYSADYGETEFIPYETADTARDDLTAGELQEYIIIPDNYIQTGLVERFLTERELEIPVDTFAAVRSFLLDNLLEGQVGPDLVERAKNPLGVQSVRLDETGNVAEDQGGFQAFVFPMVFGFLLIITIMSASGYLLQGLGEEKENRVMEILLSSVSSRQLLVGKVLGLGAAGLAQMIFWLLSSIFIVRLASTSIGGFFSEIQIPSNLLVLGIVYYVLGYLFFAVIMAGIGAVTSTAKEGSQLSVILVLPAILPFYISFIFLQDNPNHVINTVLTLIPVTAPMSVFIRLGTGEIAPWELITSILLLIAGIAGGLWLAAKIFRIFLLMYGKTPSAKDMFRLLRQA